MCFEDFGKQTQLKYVINRKEKEIHELIKQDEKLSFLNQRQEAGNSCIQMPVLLRISLLFPLII